jgi:hypothetical protein
VVFSVPSGKFIAENNLVDISSRRYLCLKFLFSKKNSFISDSMEEYSIRKDVDSPLYKYLFFYRFDIRESISGYIIP